MSNLKLSLTLVRRSPVAPVIAALSLALGMGLVTVVCGIVEATYFRPLPFAEQERLIHVSELAPQSQNVYASVSARHFVAALDDAKSFESLGAASAPSVIALGESGYASRATSVEVTPSFFRVLRTGPLLGRTFVEGEGAANIQPVLLSWAVWQSHFGSDRSIIGKTTFIDGAPAEIIGVMPKSFTIPTGADVWRPLDEARIRITALTNASRDLWVIGRLAPGTEAPRAGSQLTSMFRQIDANQSDVERVQARVESLASSLHEADRQQAVLWMAAAVIIGLLCVVNFSTMTLARGLRRRTEIATRLALGASPRTIISLLTAEAIVVAAVGAVLAVVVAHWLLQVPHLLFGSRTMAVQPTLTWSAVAVGMLLTLVLGFVFALVPAYQLARTDVRLLCSAGSTTTGKENRSRQGLVALQLGISVACVTMLAALVGAFQRQEAEGPGYQYDHVMTARLLLRDSSAQEIPEESIISFLRQQPGVQSAAVVRPYGRPSAARLIPSPGAIPAGMNHYDVSPSFFAVIGVRPLAGRLPTAGEAESHAPVLVATTTTAKWMSGWWNGSAVNHTVGLSLGRRRTPDWQTIVGIVPDIHIAPDFESVAAPNFTVQGLPMGRSTSIVLFRTTGLSAPQVRELRSRLAAFDSRVIFTDLTTVTEQVNEWLAPARARILFFVLISALAVTLAIIGIYGLTSYSTEVRARELGIRMALGANTARVSLVVLKELGGIALLAAAGGLLVGARAVSLVNVTLGDSISAGPFLSFPIAPVTLGVLTLLAVSALGTFVPIRRLLHLDIARIVQSR